jgi:hypothetical protein
VEPRALLLRISKVTGLLWQVLHTMVGAVEEFRAEGCDEVRGRTVRFPSSAIGSRAWSVHAALMLCHFLRGRMARLALVVAPHCPMCC